MEKKKPAIVEKKRPLTVYLRAGVRRFIEARVRDTKYPYRTVSDYLEAMTLLDRAGGVPHIYLSEIINRPEWARGELMEELRRKIDACKKKNADNW